MLAASYWAEQPVDGHCSVTAALASLGSLPCLLSQSRIELGMKSRAETGPHTKTTVVSEECRLWDITPCGYCKNRRFEERITSIFRVTRMSSQSSSVDSYC
jgi:hypothetical protein